MTEKEIVRILAEARFKFRSDTLANWESINPTLLSGEFGVVTDGTETEKVKIGDGVTPWTELGWWKGPEGKQGIEGKQGKPGESGQDGNDGADGKDGLTPCINENGNWQIGDTDTGIKATGDNGTDGVGISNVSINSDGELIITLTTGSNKNLGSIKGEPGKDAITDQTYDPESENAQSGKAVAEAVKDLQKHFADVEVVDKDYNELILTLLATINTIDGKSHLILKGGQILLEDGGGSVKIKKGVISTSQSEMKFVDGETFSTPIPIKIGSPTEKYHAATKEYVDSAIGEALEGDY